MSDDEKPVISLGSNFTFGAVDGIGRAAHEHLELLSGITEAVEAAPTSDLGPLAPMVGDWQGTGFNTIFRPLNPKSPNTLPIAPTGDNILELNLTHEKTAFTVIPGPIPNRGMVMADIALFGMTYLQKISDVTTQPSVGIHVEPGIWIVVPPTTSPAEGQTVARMASIPHGTTINAQGTTRKFAGPPTIPAVDITPNLLANGQKVRFPSQTAATGGTPRIPQDLTSFIAAGTLTQGMIDDPNVVLRSAIAGQTLTETTEITISTEGLPASPSSGGTANIAHLVNGGEDRDKVNDARSPNANGVKMTATFWIERVSMKVTIPVFRPGNPPVRVAIGGTQPGQPKRFLLLNPAREVTAPKVITIHFTQIQYTQNVFLNFNGLQWPHVSVATLVPSSVQTIPASAWT